MSTSAHRIASELGSHEVITLETTSATIQHAAPGRSYSGPLYVATPQLLKDLNITSSSVAPHAEILSMRPGFAALTKMQIVYGDSVDAAGELTARGNVDAEHGDH
jgi:hypothetical protein